MANTKSAKKRARQNTTRKDRNAQIKNQVRTALKSAYAKIEENSQGAAEFVKMAISTIEKAASKGALHKKKASRTVSRLSKQLTEAINELTSGKTPTKKTTKKTTKKKVTKKKATKKKTTKRKTTKKKK